MKQLTIQEVKKLQGIINRTKKKRIKLKLIKRISNGTFDCWCKWIRDKEAHNTIDAIPGGFRMPSTIEMMERYN